MEKVILESIQVGKPRLIVLPGASGPAGRPWNSAFMKQPVKGPIQVGLTNLDRDEQADRSVHGGPDKAICAYSADHYPDWRVELALPKMAPGAFGENFTIAGITEADVCIGDRWQVGEVELEISQPRQPCWKLARRWDLIKLPAWVIRSGRTGWYFRVKREGIVQAGDEMSLLDRPNPDWTISWANEVMYAKKGDQELRTALASVPELSESWRGELDG